MGRLNQLDKNTSKLEKSLVPLDNNLRKTTQTLVGSFYNLQKKVQILNLNLEKPLNLQSFLSFQNKF